MRSKSFARECLKAFLKYARRSPEGQGTVLLDVSDSTGKLRRRGPQARTTEEKPRTPPETE